MGRAVLIACLPWAGLLAVALAALWLLVRLNRARPQLRRLRLLHRDEVGGVQSLAFVLTLPFFVMILLFIVQVSQLMIGTVVVHYAAFAAARSAMVWIPAAVSPSEGPNCISFNYPDPEAPQEFPVLDPEAAGYGPSQGGVTCIIEPGSEKYDKIFSAAALALMPISPSRDWGGGGQGDHAGLAAAVKSAYRAIAPGSASNARVSARVDNKLAWAMAATELQIRFYHQNAEPPLLTHFIEDDPTEFRSNELGWQDQIQVKLKYDLALLPGPGRLLARFVPGPSGDDKVSRNVRQQGDVYVYPLTASAIIGNEGEKPVLQYVH